ncbi:MAG: adenylate/guanylate cyclase domain-containing protein [Bacteroidetes bacterium]|nr:adenylate/guanylate cyclase domain-containing protein [Bacteroidota bacterium]
MNTSNSTFFEIIKSKNFRNFMLYGDFKNIFIFSILVTFFINFFRQINSLLGRKVLYNYLSGKYHKPRAEKRLFMFLDLSSSTTIAEKLGPVEYHKFINSFFFDIDSSIVYHKADVYQYVGDEVIVSWINDLGFENSRCLDCFYSIKKVITDKSEKFKAQYGVVPEFKAGMHYGEVITGEIGDSKKEIVFLGDVLNTASRIQAQCKILGKNLLISEDVKNNLNSVGKYKTETAGRYKLRGKENEVELFSVENVSSE